MGVASHVRRSFAIAAATLLAGGVLDVVYLAGFCPAGHLNARLKRHEPVVVDSGFRYAMPGEAIFTCTRPHRLGPIVLHDDFGCYCAPADMSAVAVGAWLGGSCTIERPTPLRTDSSGICRHAHCDDPAN